MADRAGRVEHRKHRHPRDRRDDGGTVVAQQARVDQMAQQQWQQGDHRDTRHQRRQDDDCRAPIASDVRTDCAQKRDDSVGPVGLAGGHGAGSNHTGRRSSGSRL